MQPGSISKHTCQHCRTALSRVNFLPLWCSFIHLSSELKGNVGELGLVHNHLLVPKRKPTEDVCFVFSSRAAILASLCSNARWMETPSFLHPNPDSSENQGEHLALHRRSSKPVCGFPALGEWCVLEQRTNHTLPEDFLWHGSCTPTPANKYINSTLTSCILNAKQMNPKPSKPHNPWPFTLNQACADRVFFFFAGGGNNLGPPA